MPGAFRAVAWGALTAGVMLAPHMGGWLGATTPWAARAAGGATFLAGLLVCIATYRRAPRTTAVFDRRRQVFDVAVRSLRRTQRAAGLLGDVADVQLGEGRDSDNDPIYRVTLVLASGARLPLSPDHLYPEPEARAAANAVRALLGMPPAPLTAPAPPAGAPASRLRGALVAVAAMPFVLVLMVGLLLPFAGVAFTGLGVAVDLMRRATYRPVPAVVVAADIRARTSRGTASWAPQVSYRYTVDGRSYTADRFRTVGPADGWTRAWAEGVVRRYAPGRTVTAYVSPDDASHAFLDRGLPAGLYLALLGTGGIAGVIIHLARRGAPPGVPRGWSRG